MFDIQNYNSNREFPYEFAREKRGSANRLIEVHVVVYTYKTYVLSVTRI